MKSIIIGNQKLFWIIPTNQTTAYDQCLLTEYVKNSMILHNIVSLKFVVCSSTGDHLLVMQRSRTEPDPTLSDIIVRTHHVVCIGRPHI